MFAKNGRHLEHHSPPEVNGETNSCIASTTSARETSIIVYIQSAIKKQ